MVCTSCFIGSCPSEYGVLKKTWRSWSRRSRREAAVGRAVAVGPVVVARREHRRRVERVEVAETLHGKGVAAGCRRDGAGRAVAGLQVAVVNRERELRVVHVGDQVRHAGRRLHVAVRQVAPEPDRVLKGSSCSCSPLLPTARPATSAAAIAAATKKARAIFASLRILPLRSVIRSRAEANAANALNLSPANTSLPDVHRPATDGSSI